MSEIIGIKTDFGVGMINTTEVYSVEVFQQAVGPPAAYRVRIYYRTGGTIEKYSEIITQNQTLADNVTIAKELWDFLSNITEGSHLFDPSVPIYILTTYNLS